MLLTSETVDDVFEYVRAQTNKIDPVIGSLQRAAFIDQLVESYIADIMLFLLESLGTTRAEQFKRTHLGFNKINQSYLYPYRKTFQEEENSFMSDRPKKKQATMLGSRTSYEKNSDINTADMLSNGEGILLQKKANGKK